MISTHFHYSLPPWFSILLLLFVSLSIGNMNLKDDHGADIVQKISEPIQNADNQHFSSCTSLMQLWYVSRMNEAICANTHSHSRNTLPLAACQNPVNAIPWNYTLTHRLNTDNHKTNHTPSPHYLRNETSSRQMHVDTWLPSSKTLPSASHS